MVRFPRDNMLKMLGTLWAHNKLKIKRPHRRKRCAVKVKHILCTHVGVIQTNQRA